MNKKRKAYSRYSKEIKLEAIRRVLEDDQPVQEVIIDLGIRHRDNVYEWIKKYNKYGPQAFERGIQNGHLQMEIDPIQKQIEDLKNEVEALKTCLEALVEDEDDKYRAFKILNGQYSIETICSALDVTAGEFEMFKLRQG